MVKSFWTFAIVAASAVMLTIGAPAPAQAGKEGAAFFGGLLLGGALGAGARPAYTAPPPVYVAPQPYYQPRCWWEKRRISDGYGGWHWRRVQVCE
jgi:hypothetical protein